jgi:thymidylate synthase
MCLVQRSGDLLAASCSGVNETQYAALMMMVARHCGYEVGIFSHFVCNEQIYSRHIDGANTILSRAKGLKEAEHTCFRETVPNLILNPEKTNFHDFTIDDFTMENYYPINPQIKFELGI